MTFEEWKLTQIADSNVYAKWNHKFNNKTKSAKSNGGVLNLLNIEQYLFKAYEAGITHPDQISQTGYHLSRLGDTGNYTVESCRFLDCDSNWAERNTSGEKHSRTSLTNILVESIFTDLRTDLNLIASDYGCSRKVVHDIKSRKRWTSVTNNL